MKKTVVVKLRTQRNIGKVNISPEKKGWIIRTLSKTTVPVS